MIAKMEHLRKLHQFLRLRCYFDPTGFLLRADAPLMRRTLNIIPFKTFNMCLFLKFICVDDAVCYYSADSTMWLNDFLSCQT